MARARPVGLPANLSETPNGLVRYVSPCPCRSTGEGLGVGIRWRCERQKGIGVRRLSKELGLSADTLRAWLRVVGDGATAKMKSVRVVERPATATTPGRFTLAPQPQPQPQPLTLGPHPHPHAHRARSPVRTDCGES